MPTCNVHRSLTGLVLEVADIPSDVKENLLKYICEADDVDKRDYFYARGVSYTGKRKRRLKPRYGAVRHHASPELVAAVNYYYCLTLKYILLNKDAELLPILARLVHYFQDMQIPYKGRSGSHVVVERALKRLLDNRDVVNALKDIAKRAYSETMDMVLPDVDTLEEEVERFRAHLSLSEQPRALSPNEILKNTVKSTASLIALMSSLMRKSVREELIQKHKLAKAMLEKCSPYQACSICSTIIDAILLLLFLLLLEPITFLFFITCSFLAAYCWAKASNLCPHTTTKLEALLSTPKIWEVRMEKRFYKVQLKPYYE